MGWFRQFAALCRKNWIILWRHKYINVLRCVILPIAYAAFFANAQNFFTTPVTLGKGHIAPLLPISRDLDNHKLVWAPPASARQNATIATFIDTLMERALEGVEGHIVKVNGSNQVVRQCPENFNLLSECFAAVTFNGVDISNSLLDYTLRDDFGLARVDVDNLSNDDVQVRLLPLQWAIDSHFINMTTGTMPHPPMQWEYTNESQADHLDMNRMSYLRGIRSLIVLAFFLVFLGVVYQLPGSMASERATGLTSHLKAMGCRDSARVVSWHVSVSGAYFIAWVIVAAILQQAVFKRTNAGLLIVSYVVTGLSLGSWTYLVAVPFANAPTLAAITATFLAIILAICALLVKSGAGVQLVLTLVFPPMYYIFFTKAVANFELVPAAPNILHRSPGGDAPILGLLIIAIIDILLYPTLATLLENKLYHVSQPTSAWARFWARRHQQDLAEELPGGVAVQVDHLRKEYSTKRFGFLGRGRPVVAIEDLSFTVPTGEIFCCLGRNGAAKSTTMSIIARLQGMTSGSIRYADDLHIGIASQKDILWDELTCKQHIELWRAIKTSPRHRQTEPDLDLLARCDLAPKVRFLSKNLSGGQKRKLQLACALAGGSNLLLLDEISSGLDPLSRRAIWKLITANRGAATIFLTTHFLDEADYLGDKVAILKAPGKLLALDGPVALKGQLGRGFSVSLDASSTTASKVCDAVKITLPAATMRETRGWFVIATGSSDPAAVRRALEGLAVIPDLRYQVNSTTLEEVFLDLNSEPRSVSTSGSETPVNDKGDVLAVHSLSSQSMEPGDIAPELFSTPRPTEGQAVDHLALSSSDEKDVELSSSASPPDVLVLTPGRKRSRPWSYFSEAGVIFLKRLIVFRRSWLLPLVGVVVVICASSIPLFFIAARRQTCAVVTNQSRAQKLSWPSSPYPVINGPLVFSPESLLNNGISVPTNFIESVADNTSFVDFFDQNYTQVSYGGVSFAQDVNSPSLFAWEGTSLTNKGPSALNLLTNGLLDQIRPLTATSSTFRINLNFRYLASPSFTSTAQAFKWVAFFGLGISIWSAFAVIYPTVEGASTVRANQYSNGATPAALWLGHLLFELPGIFLVSTVLILVFAFASEQFHYLGYLWICFILYGIGATLYAYIFALFLNSPLAAWAVVAGTNVILFLLYLAAYLLILTYDRSSAAASHITIAHFTIGLINPVPNIMRAVLVSINLFSLLCNGLGAYSTSSPAAILKFGGPILYLVVQIIFAFSVLVYVDSGAPLPRFLTARRRQKAALSVSTDQSEDVLAEAARIASESNDMLKVQRITKKYFGAPNLAVDDVSFGVSEGTTFALIGPNGAGKSSLISCIRGSQLPTAGDALIDNSHSIVKQRNAARLYLGVCPQTNAIDANLTVRQHLWLYGRLKGVSKGPLKQDIDTLLAFSGLSPKADQLATSLSGGNQRKLALMVALIGDRPIVLIDEFSSGVDPFSKREAWTALERLTKDRAVVMTTHSMEEVDALANRVGIVASKMLAVGSPADLKGRFATYELHLPAASIAPTVAHLRGKGFPAAYASLDASTRISIPQIQEGDIARLLQIMEGLKSEGAGQGEVTIHEASTETAFLEIVRKHNVQEEEGRLGREANRGMWRRLWNRRAV